MKKIDLNFFPGYTRKAISYTIDDGNVPLDIKFLNIVKPHGFKGTFNLSNASRPGYTPEDYRRIYEGCEIANHCYTHPAAIPDDLSTKVVSDEYYDDATAEQNVWYKSPKEEGVYLQSRRHRGIGPIRFIGAERYINHIKEAQEELEAVFGKGSVVQFVWPYGEQKNKEILEYLRNSDFYAVRKTGNLEDKTAFAIPEKFNWTYSAGYEVVVSVADKFDAYPDDGELKLFTFGIHSHDYENNDKWGDLEYVANKLGDRPNDFWYATNIEVFRYDDAVKAVEVTDTEIYNPSNITLYIKIDGVPTTLPAGAKISI